MIQSTSKSSNQDVLHPVHPNLVKVRHGLNEGDFNLSGQAVTTVQESLADAFNIPLGAFGYINGQIVGEEFQVSPGDTLEFIFPLGIKGGTPRKRPDRDKHKSPFPYFGGKSAVAPEVWRRFGDVKNYVEPFFGSGAVLLNRPAMAENRIEVVNDIDSLLTNYWRAVKLHPKALAALADYPISEPDLHARHQWLIGRRHQIQEKLRADPYWYDATAAAWWVWGVSQWIGGGWGTEAQSRSRSRPRADRTGVHRLGNKPRAELLKESYLKLQERLDNVAILSGDWSRLLTPSMTIRRGKVTGVFLDPPYTDQAERKKGLYAMDDLNVGHQVRDWAVAHGDDPRYRIALCGYEGEYQMPENWSVYLWKSRGSKNGHKERIWFSPHCLQ